MKATATVLWTKDYPNGKREVALRIMHPDADTAALVDDNLPAGYGNMAEAEQEKAWGDLYDAAHPAFTVVDGSRGPYAPDFVIRVDADATDVSPGFRLTIEIG